MKDWVVMWPTWLMTLFFLMAGFSLACWAKNTLLRTLRRLNPDHAFYHWGRWLSLLIMVMTLVVTLDLAGFDMTALMAGLGITGVSIGFASKDVLGNLIAGLLLLVYRPFKIGDYIKVKGYEGRVSEMNLRHVILFSQTYGKVLTPNAILLAEPVLIVVDDTFDA